MRGSPRHLKRKKQRPLCWWQEIVVQSPHGNLASVVLHLVIHSGLTLYDVFALREVCREWRRIVDAQNHFFEQVCAHLVCERKWCSYYSLYGLTDGHLVQLWEVAASRERELFARIIGAYLGWPSGVLWHVTSVSDSNSLPYNLDDPDVRMFYHEGPTHEFLWCRGRNILHREGPAFEWKSISLTQLTQPYVDSVKTCLMPPVTP